MVVHLPGLFEEIDGLAKRGVQIEGRLFLSDRAHLLFDLHKEIDGLREEELAGKQIGEQRSLCTLLQALSMLPCCDMLQSVTVVPLWTIVSMWSFRDCCQDTSDTSELLRSAKVGKSLNIALHLAS